MRYNLLLVVSVVVGWTTIRSHIHRSHQRDDKIVGGEAVTDIRIAPYVISIQLKDPYDETLPWDQIAAGTILSPLYVITACHCVADTDDDGNIISMLLEYPLKYWRFVAGATRLDKLDGFAVQYGTPVSLNYHPECQLEKDGAPYLRNDVGLAKMSKPFRISEFVKPVGFFSFNRTTFEAEVDKIISSQDLTLRDKSPVCKVAGWGRTNSTSILEQFGITTTTVTPPSDPVKPKEYRRRQLKSLGVYPMYDKQCLDKMVEAIKAGLGSLAYLITSATEEAYKLSLLDQICALSKHDNESTCYGDSGSGLVCNGFYVAVTSWSVGCGAGSPDVFQSLPKMLDWLVEAVCAVESCQDAQNIHQHCKPPNREYLLKCENADNDAATRSPHGIAHKIAVNQWLALALANIGSIMQ